MGFGLIAMNILVCFSDRNDMFGGKFISALRHIALDSVWTEEARRPVDSAELKCGFVLGFIKAADVPGESACQVALPAASNA